MKLMTVVMLSLVLLLIGLRGCRSAPAIDTTGVIDCGLLGDRAIMETSLMVDHSGDAVLIRTAGDRSSPSRRWRIDLKQPEQGPVAMPPDPADPAARDAAGRHVPEFARPQPTRVNIARHFNDGSIASWSQHADVLCMLVESLGTQWLVWTSQASQLSLPTDHIATTESGIRHDPGAVAGLGVLKLGQRDGNSAPGSEGSVMTVLRWCEICVSDTGHWVALLVWSHDVDLQSNPMGTTIARPSWTTAEIVDGRGDQVRRRPIESWLDADHVTDATILVHRGRWWFATAGRRLLSWSCPLGMISASPRCIAGSYHTVNDPMLAPAQDGVVLVWRDTRAAHPVGWWNPPISAHSQIACCPLTADGGGPVRMLSRADAAASLLCAGSTRLGPCAVWTLRGLDANDLTRFDPASPTRLQVGILDSR